MDIMLALDRSTSPGSFALIEGDRLTMAGHFAADGSRAPAWAAELGGVLAAAGVAPAALGGMIVGLGPGSFSGVRAAIAFLQGLALPGGLPLWGLAGAAALARREALAGGVPGVVVVGDARRGCFWAAAYRLDAAGRLCLGGAGAGRPSHTAADFAVGPWSALGAALPADALAIGSEAGLPTDGGAGGESRKERPALRVPSVTAADLAALWLADPAAARRDPLPIYLHPAVSAA
jgi:tRNA threonylcarbamoyladenosine biosynthesis protein TsaB